MDVIWQILNVNLKLAIRASGNVLQTVHHMQVYVLSVDLFSTIRNIIPNILDLPVITLHHWTVCAFGYEGGLYHLGRCCLDLNIRVFQLTFQAHVLFPESLNLSK